MAFLGHFKHRFIQVTAWWQILDRVMTDSLPPGKLLHRLFAGLLSFTLSNKMQSIIRYREEFNRCKIYRMDKICLELRTFKEFATAVLQTLTIRAKRRSTSCDLFLKSRELNQRCVTAWKKKAISKVGPLSGVISCWRAKYKILTDRD